MFKKLSMAVLIGLLVVAIASFGIAATSSVNIAGDQAYGIITSSGATITVPIGWQPREVIVSKPGGTYVIQGYWETNMPAGSCIKTAATTTTVGKSSGVSVVTYPTVSCVSLYTGGASTAPGFYLGADTDINTLLSDTIYWRAMR